MYKQVIIVNPNSNNAKKVIRYLESKNMQYYLTDEIEKKIKEDNKEFLICGGDGTINRFINMIMKMPKKKRIPIRFGIIPCGRANDLARYMKIPLNIKHAFNKLKDNKEKKIDLIKINKNYIVTGGGVGLPAETVMNVNSFSNGFPGRYLKKSLGDLSYLLFTLKKFILGYEPIEIAGKNKPNKLLAIYVLNQPFLGKRFCLAPEAKNDDGKIDIKIIDIPPSFSKHFNTLSKGIKGELKDLEWVKSKKTAKLIFDRPVKFYNRIVSAV